MVRLLLVLLAGCASVPEAEPVVATYSIVAYDSLTQELGVAVQSKYFSVGRVVPWAELCALVEPVYPKGEGGRPTIPLEWMLRIYFLQQWFNLGDPTVEEALYDSASMRAFAGIDLAAEPVPDETTICKFRHLLERNKLGTRIFQEVGRYLQSQGLRVSSGTIVDATVISAPSSTKNAEGKRDPKCTRPGRARTGTSA